MKKTLGETLKEYREEKRVSQKEMSKQVGITQAAIARYELNRTEPRASDIVKLCRYFQVSPNELLGFED